MSRGAVQPAIVTLLKPLRSQPEAVRQLNVVQSATVIRYDRIRVTPSPVR